MPRIRMRSTNVDFAVPVKVLVARPVAIPVAMIVSILLGINAAAGAGAPAKKPAKTADTGLALLEEGESALQSRDWARAERAFRSAIAKAPKSARAHSDLAITLTLSGKA